MTNRVVRVALVGCDTYVVAMVRSVRGAAHVTVVSPTCIGSADALAQAHEVIVDVGVRVAAIGQTILTSRLNLPSK